jgi:predicted RNA-binding Zn-ribbon protein involved in translation (DUF1610 family)
MTPERTTSMDSEEDTDRPKCPNCGSLMYRDEQRLSISPNGIPGWACVECATVFRIPNQ